MIQFTEKIKNCNGCEACVVGCKYGLVTIQRDEQGHKYPVINEDGCISCNHCYMYCPIYNPISLPEFKTFSEYKDEYYERDMAMVYRETMKTLKTGQNAEFTGTLCQIAALKSLMGDKLKPRLKVTPVYCDPQAPRRPECGACPFY